jgi:hypothetical protein
MHLSGERHNDMDIDRRVMKKVVEAKGGGRENGV